MPPKAIGGNTPRCSPPSASTYEDIAFRTRRKWGDGGLVNHWCRRGLRDLRDRRTEPQPAIRCAFPCEASPSGKTVAPNHQSRPIIDLPPGILLTVQRGG